MADTGIDGVPGDRTDTDNVIAVKVERPISGAQWCGLVIAIPLIALGFGLITLWIGGII